MKTKYYEEHECPTCKQKKCFEHCNNCGDDIKWTNYLGDPYYETNPKGRRVRYAYNKDDSVHRCMKQGTRKGNYFGARLIGTMKTNIIGMTVDELPNKYYIDEYRNYERVGGPVFKCTLCGRRADLPWLKSHHPKDPKCEAILMEKFFKEKPTRVIDINNENLDEY